MPTLELADWKVSYQESGVGLPLVFVPGIEEYKESFLFQLRGLSDRYRVIAYDVRDAGSPKCGDVSVLAQDLANFLDAMRLSSAVIIGHSFGGLIAQEFARTYPQRATALVLISSFAKAPTTHHAPLLRYMSSGHMNDPESAIGRFMQKLGLFTPPAKEVDEHLAWVSKQAAKTGAATVHERLKLIRHFDSRPWLEQLWMPLLALVGQYDRPSFLSASQMIQRASPDSVVEVIEGTAHFPHIERHDLVNFYIDDFVGTRLISLID